MSGGTGLGKPLKLMLRPLRAEIPIYLATIAPKAVEQAFEIADGWLPIFWSPEKARDVFPVARAREGFDIAPSVPALLIDDVEAGRNALKEYYAFYIGGMGARGKNFYNDLFARYGHEDAAREIQDPSRRRPAQRGGEGARLVRRRSRARRAEGADRRAHRSVARVGDIAARLDARPRDLARGRRSHPLSDCSAVSASSGTPASKRAASVSSLPSSPRMKRP